MYLINVSDKNIEILIKSGCLDSFKLTHTTMLSELSSVIRYTKLCTFEENGKIIVDLSLVSPPRIKIKSENIAQLLEEKETYLGLFLGPHPVEKYRMDYQNTIPSIVAKNSSGEMSLIVAIMSYRHKQQDQMN